MDGDTEYYDPYDGTDSVASGAETVQYNWFEQMCLNNNVDIDVWLQSNFRQRMHLLLHHAGQIVRSREA